MATQSLVQFALLASVIWTGGVSGEDYQSDHYSEDEYDSGGGSRSAEAPKDTGFVTPLDFTPLFQGHAFGLTPLASQPMAAAILQADKSQYPALFDTAVASSIDLLQPQVAASEHVFSPENFGFKPVVSQGFLPAPAQYVQPQKYRHNQQHNVVEIERTKATAHTAALTRSPLQYNIQTRHDPNYRVYKSEDDLEGTEILAALKKNPAVSSYFTPQASNIEISHPQHYRKEEVGGDNNLQNYRANAYLAGSSNPASRTRRYTDSRRPQRHHKHSSEEADESPHNYKSDYRVRPKEFDSGPYSSPYTDDRKENDDDYGYDYGSEYNNDDYERIKKLSEAQAAEIKENPEHCKEVKKDSMTCMVCKNPKTGGNYESCSYVAEPKSNKYAYSREKKFDSKDAPDEPADDKSDSQETKPAKLQNEDSSDESDDSSKQSESVPKYKSTYRPPQQPYAKYSSEPKQPYHGYKRDPSDSSASSQYKYPPTSAPHSAAYSEAEDDDESDEKSNSKAYNYKAAIPGFYTDNGPKKDVEHVLAEFKKKDRSACKKVHKNGMTCYQCIDANGLKHEECMFISESQPKRSHLAYQELKEFTSKPATLDGNGNEGAESQIVTTATPPAQKSAAYVAASAEPYGVKLKRKKVQGTATATVAPVKSLPLKALRATAAESRNKPTSVRVARSSDDGAQVERDVLIPDETKIAPPEEFAGEASKGAFWAETQPRYSKTLGVTLPEFMLSASEHELSFDETVAGA